MKRWLWLALPGLLLMAPWAATSPKLERKPITTDAPPFGAQYFAFVCNANERTVAGASGKGRAPLGLYVFDPHGNCIARDESLGFTKWVDDVAVEWFPPAALFYTIELRNQGLETNEVFVAFN